MHIYHFINNFDALYGKKHKRIEWSIHSSSIFAKVIYEPDESYIIRIWVKEYTDLITQEKRTSFVLFKDNIYTNDYFMPDKNTFQHFYEIRRQFYNCPADFIAGQIDINQTLDNKLLRILYQTCLHERDFLLRQLATQDVWTNNEDYNTHLHDLHQLIPIEQYLYNEISTRQLPAKPQKRKQP